MTASSGIENRAARRVPIRLTVILKDETFSGSMYFYSRDLSANGIFLESDILLQEDVVVDILFELPGDEPKAVRAVGQIVRVEDRVEDGIVPGLGVRFLELKERDQAILDQFIAEQGD